MIYIFFGEILIINYGNHILTQDLLLNIIIYVSFLIIFIYIYNKMIKKIMKN
jgi:hypothetical protein